MKQETISIDTLIIKKATFFTASDQCFVFGTKSDDQIRAETIDSDDFYEECCCDDADFYVCCFADCAFPSYVIIRADSLGDVLDIFIDQFGNRGEVSEADADDMGQDQRDELGWSNEHDCLVETETINIQRITHTVLSC